MMSTLQWHHVSITNWQHDNCSKEMAQLGGKKQKLPSTLKQSWNFLHQQPYQPLNHQKVISCHQLLNNIKAVHSHQDW